MSIQKVDLRARREWLSAQIARNGVFSTEYDEDTNFPTEHDNESGEGGFTCSPNTSYGAKLLAAYRMLGGRPEFDMLLRTSDQPVFLTRGTNLESGEGNQKTGYSDTFSNGRRDRGGMRFDRDLGLKVEKVKLPFLEAIKQKREKLEFKIKRCLDYSDQLQREADQIDTLLGEGPGSLDAILGAVVVEMSTSSSFGVIENEDDKFGLGIGRVADLTWSDALDEAQMGGERIPK